MIRRLGSDLTVAVVAAGSAAAMTFPYGFGWGEFFFVACLAALLLVGLRQAGQNWSAASAQRRRARALAVTSPSEAAVRAADLESARMAGDIRGTLRTAFDGIAVEVTQAQDAAPPDLAGLDHVSAIQRHGVIATTELRRMLGLLRSPTEAPDRARIPTPPPSLRSRVAVAVMSLLMVTEIMLTASFWGEDNGVLPGTGWEWLTLQVMLSLVVVVVFGAPLAAWLACFCAAAALLVGYVLAAPVLDGLWLGFVLALLAWRVVARPSDGWWGYAALVVLCLAAANSIQAYSPGNLGVHAVMVGGAVLTGVIARVGDRLRATAHARVVHSEHVLAEETERAIRSRRLKVARELHDALSGTVGVIVAQAGAAEVQWLSRPERAKTALGVVADAVEHARRDLDQLAPVGQESDPLPGMADVPALVQRMRSAGIDVSITELPTGLPEEVSAAAYRIVQECLANVARHAPGARAMVSATLAGDLLEVTVADNGPGVARSDAGGYGLTGLRERAALLAGTLTLDSGADGLRVIARIPMSVSQVRTATSGADRQPDRKQEVR